MKSVLISIRPEWVKKILDKEKTVEIRKNAPKITTPFKCYIYCTHSKNGIAYCKGNDILNGKVIGEFVCDEIIVAPCGQYCKIPLAEAHLDSLDLMDYADSKTVYGWHISDLKIYDKPKKLDDFHRPCEEIENCWNKAFREAGHCLDKCFDCGNRIKRPPQSWCYVEGKDDTYA